MYTASDHTFVVCAYGESPYLQDCLASLARQTARTRIIVTTSTLNPLIHSVAEQFGVPLLVNKGKAGIAHDWNCALAHAGASLVTIAHQDDTYEPRYAECLLDYCNGAMRPLLLVPSRSLRTFRQPN